MFADDFPKGISVVPMFLEAALDGPKLVAVMLETVNVTRCLVQSEAPHSRQKKRRNIPAQFPRGLQQYFILALKVIFVIVGPSNVAAAHL